jgi:glycosyltransferase involved in cell wall biosynthesis
VLFVINGLGTGGAERSLAEMLPGMASAGVASTIACLIRRAEGVEEEVRRQGFDVRILEGDGFLSRARALRRLIAAKRPHLVHTAIFESDLAGRLAAVGTSVPVLSSLVSMPYDPIRRRDPNVRAVSLGAARLIDGWTGRHMTAHFHANSHAVKRAAMASLHIRPDRITVVERGRDRARLGDPGGERRRRVRAGLGLREDHEVLVNVGRREYAKGQRYVLEALSLLIGDRPRLRLLIAGRSGRQAEQLSRITGQLALGERVEFLGHRADVPDLLAAADVFVFPSLYEGLPGVLIEAMALGLPIVASDLEAIREVVEVGRSALLVPPGDPEALALAIARLLDDRALARSFGAYGRRVFEQRFTLERSTQRMVDLYRDLVWSRGHPTNRASARTAIDKRLEDVRGP